MVPPNLLWSRIRHRAGSQSIASRRSVDGLRTAVRVLVVGYFVGSLSASRMRLLLSVRRV